LFEALALKFREEEIKQVLKRGLDGIWNAVR